MSARNRISRRELFAIAASVPLASAAARVKNIPVGLELYSVRDRLKDDTLGTVRGVAQMGYQVVEFFAPYYEWTPDYAKEVRKTMDDAGVRCLSTHNGPKSFSDEGMQKAIDLNKILGAQFVVWASAGNVKTIDGWKGVADTLTKASEKLGTAGLRAGYHNHELEFTPIDGKRPMEVIAANTPKNVMLQFDVGTCVKAGSDPVAWIDSNPGRINSLHLKDWSPDADKGFKVLFGEGVVPWKKVFAAAESTGGVEYYLIEQEGSRFPSMETAEKCLANYKKIHG